jgi:histone-binding protein RBBP4
VWILNSDYSLKVICIVLTSGKDMCVVLWSIEDFTTAAKEPSPSKPITPTGSKQKGIADSTKVAPRGIFKGHTETVEDVQFHPTR